MLPDFQLRRRECRPLPADRERIKLLRDVLTAADFFFVDQLPPYDPAELIPQKGDAAMALKSPNPSKRSLGPNRIQATTLGSSPTHRSARTGYKSGTNVPADSRCRLRAQERPAIV